MQNKIKCVSLAAMGALHKSCKLGYRRQYKINICYFRYFDFYQDKIHFYIKF